MAFKIAVIISKLAVIAKIAPIPTELNFPLFQICKDTPTCIMDNNPSDAQRQRKAINQQECHDS